MKRILKDKNGIVPIIDTSKLHMLKVTFIDTPHINRYYLCVAHKGGAAFIENKGIEFRDQVFNSNSIQECIKIAFRFVSNNDYWRGEIYQFENVQEAEDFLGIEILREIYEEDYYDE